MVLNCGSHLNMRDPFALCYLCGRIDHTQTACTDTISASSSYTTGEDRYGDWLRAKPRGSARKPQLFQKENISLATQSLAAANAQKSYSQGSFSNTTNRNYNLLPTGCTKKQVPRVPLSEISKPISLPPATTVPLCST